MKILYYEWKENSRDDMIATLQLLGHQVIRCHIPCGDYEYDDAFMERLERAIEQYQCEMVFSFNYFPVIAKVAQRLCVDYLSWIYDSPHWTLFSPTAASPYNYIYTFDYEQYLMLQGRNVPHVYHLPLAVNTRRLNEQLGLPKDDISYRAQVSFVGSLYENNPYDRIVYLPEDIKGYLDGIMDVQKLVFGADILGKSLVGKMTEKLDVFIELGMDETYGISNSELYADMLRSKLTSTERIEYLSAISKVHELSLYTGSDMSLVPGAKQCGTVSYEKEMPEVFLTSKINLNITLRSIASGIPLRALDVMGAGGFLISNYQPELATFFVAGEELVMYSAKDELLEQVAYYLEHDKKRREIAHCGWEKVQREFSYEHQVRRMFEIWENERNAG